MPTASPTIRYTDASTSHSASETATRAAPCGLASSRVAPATGVSQPGRARARGAAQRSPPPRRAPPRRRRRTAAARSRLHARARRTRTQGERADVEQPFGDDRAEHGTPRPAEQDHSHEIAGPRRQRVVAHVADERQPKALGAAAIELRAHQNPVPALGTQRRRDGVERERGGQVGERTASSGMCGACWRVAHQTIPARVASETTACSRPTRGLRVRSTVAKPA